MPFIEKNVNCRKRGMNVNKKEAIKAIEDQCEYPGNYPCAIVRTPTVLGIINGIDVPEEVDLNDAQQLVLNRLKMMFEDYNYDFGLMMYVFLNSIRPPKIECAYGIYCEMDKKEQLLVFKAFIEWAQKQEEQ